MIAAASWPHSQCRSKNLRSSTIGVRQHTSRKHSAIGTSLWQSRCAGYLTLRGGQADEFELVRGRYATDDREWWGAKWGAILRQH
jgi:hypothetical protein